MSINYFLVGGGERVSITVLDGSDMYVADSESHGNINDIIAAAVAGDPDVVDLFDIGRGINRKFENLTERVAISDGVVYLDGDPAPEAISREIIRHFNAGLDFTAMVNFLERLANNPSKDSIDQLYPWLDATGGFTITDDGDLVAYKGVKVDDNGNYVSVFKGKAIVNGQEVKGHIPNGIGDVVEMPRSEVTANSAVGCAQGLHAGTYEYANSWSRGALLEVLINPRDVVSVPSDCGAAKVRVCRYTVLDIIDKPHETPVRGYEPTTHSDFSWGDFEFEDDNEFF